jgi:pimeloyl-ACP methyl ester carboxylesterase
MGISSLFSRAAIASAAGALCLASTARAEWELPGELLDDPLYGAPDNDFSCRSEHNPIVMLHGLSANREVDLNTLSWHLKDLGYCVFSETYGAHAIPSWIGGLRHMRDSAQDIAGFIREVKDKTGTAKVDLVGHSEGGVMAIYVPMTQDGIAEIVDHNIALGPAINGAQYFGFTDLFYIGGEVTRKLAALALKTLGCPACDDMATGGAIYNDFLNASPIVQPGNKASIIMSTADTLVAPDASRIDEEGVRNVIIQDTCPDDPVGHAGLAWDKGVWELVVNELTEDYGRPFECDTGLPF